MYERKANYGGYEAERLSETAKNIAEVNVDVSVETMFKNMINGINFIKRESENASLSKLLKTSGDIQW